MKGLKMNNKISEARINELLEDFVKKSIVGDEFIKSLKSYTQFILNIGIEIGQNQSKGSTSSNQKYLSLEEASEYLGLTKATLYRYTHERVIPFYKPGGRKIYFKSTDLDEYVENGRVKSNSEIHDKATNLLVGLD